MRLGLACLIVASLLAVFSPAVRSWSGDDGVRLRMLAFFRAEPVEFAVRIPRIAVEEPFALATFYGPIEDRPSHGQMLLRHYRFGWQILTVGIGKPLDTCVLARDGVPARTRAALAEQIPPARASEPCTLFAPYSEQRAPTADETAVQHIMASTQSGHASIVAIDGSYAIAPWTGEGGGVVLFEKSGGRWHIITGGGGAVDACGLEFYGFPAAVAARLAPPPRKCTAR